MLLHEKIFGMSIQSGIKKGLQGKGPLNFVKDTLQQLHQVIKIWRQANEPPVPFSRETEQI